VATAALPAGHQLTPEDVELASTAAEARAPTMFNDPKEVEGRILASALEPGQIIRVSALTPEGTSSGLQAKIPAGMRAVTVAVNEFSGLAGLIAPGARVDLVATLTDTVTGETFAKTIVQNVLVSAVGKELEPGVTPKPDQRVTARASKTVTLLVTPTQAAAIDLAFAKSKPRLVLRSSDDEAPVRDQPVTLAELSGRTQQSFDRLSNATDEPNKETEEIKQKLAELQKQFDDARQSNMAVPTQQLLPAQEGAPSPATPHSVRIFRGSAESKQDFETPPVAPARQTERVQARPADGAAAAAAR
jgi:pilus assembly protein CpaB